MTQTGRGPDTTRLTIGEGSASLLRDGMPVRFTAYDGSAAGPPDARSRCELRNQRGLAYLLTAPGDLGMARAYVAATCELTRRRTRATPTTRWSLLQNHLALPQADPGRGAGDRARARHRQPPPPPPPPQEHLPKWRRAMEGLRHSWRATPR